MATTVAVPTSTTDIPTTSITSALPSSTATSTVGPGTDISGLVTLQVLDNTGFVVDDVATTQAIQLRIQALTTGKLCKMHLQWFLIKFGMFF